MKRPLMSNPPSHGTLTSSQEIRKNFTQDICLSTLLSKCLGTSFARYSCVCCAPIVQETNQFTALLIPAMRVVQAFLNDLQHLFLSSIAKLRGIKEKDIFHGTIPQ